ncbi:sigma-E factor regulatory protein RseB [Vibrio cincinnatiensis]|jgi:sigma-E factor negative regulatory protein RseB|uniref:Sigma E regulatory protein, MucB/RseB n=1 Tax=Vibrio cincinnatiensis DSM 19608 TaxID=1123491 RepID=A0A1T4P8B3_VIBCI|nr:sigma-E factor regulatory protein RseB [Vibrio cincinnatiensis]MCG3723392.1 sigma-E factor regulatory protein RseB [Vibrio cincinnatiensis]MCG3724481.1 sigma-E factor regulatory protein RseB [Vibrio cincinnatiensis]MCG3735206.1 sigma-E factor regulatory protein RseB [Vibrio cincinnatiensis]MCG3746208.1 sigma-E factor regulatory protein RseB [Vibrio cincinnatiensis]MCG3758512.1 sigma-E factor regulatory protein RseB [Vibrio cincinnatiensis]
MKKILISVLTLFSLNATPAFAETLSAEALLHQMNEASQHLNYELSYILIKKNSIEPLLYRHARQESQQFAHLVYLSGPVREVIRRGNEVSYVEPGVEPFTIESGNMVAPTIPMLNSDVAQLSQYYDFVKMGRAREAGSACQVLRVVPKDGLRYSYVLWVDEKSSLPLRADLVDRDGEVLEQYRTISYTINDQLATLMSGLNNVQLPEVLSLPKGNIQQTFWTVGWKPEGFQPLELNRYRMVMTERLVESQMFSDGLFNFSVYVANRDDHSLKGQLVRQGRRTVHSFVNGENEISVVGDIPPATAQRIAQSVSFESTSTRKP